MSTFDVVVIGGGPAGMMAAARAAQYGARVALLEKNRELGRKLMITGRGRCNFAHAQDDPEKLSQEYRNGGAFLLPSLQKFGTKETTAFFLRRGLVSVEERGRRLYPKEGQDASSVVNALWTALKDGGVHVLRGLNVISFDTLGGVVRRAVTSREEIDGRAFIIATGGLSFPNTGSTGDGYRWARKIGHTIVETRPALCPVKIAEHFEDGVYGLKLKNVRVTLRKNGEQLDERFGEMDFTPFGVSGAIIMDMASSIGDALKSGGAATLHIDLKPALEPERLDARIARDFEEFSGDALRFAVRKLLPREIIPTVLVRAGLDMGKPCGETSAEERAALRNTLKDFSVTPTELLGFRHAIITAGGVSTDEIDPVTMRSRLIPNLYFAGEVLDVDGPTGGYNLQECWSTGFAAGSAAAEALGFSAPSDRDIVEQMERARNRRDEQNREERAQARLEKEADEAENAAQDSGEEREEYSDDMTIQTGPTDSSE
ncbi:MAG: NAD(P)/FAD-dependent oxidoreductase, partial [Pyramidobacter sp.]|nr:NAD(P)/FAD-dependent oxidoreductase [Pyramidobacter sp.]